ncbi:MAG: hypothetical protein WC505_02080 [Patescibacteria group bacterium]
MNTITNKILDTIKEKRITPKPRWQFLLKQGLVVAVTVLSAIIGSLSFSVMLFRLVNNDWDVVRFLDRSPVQYAFSTLPYVWIILLILFIGLAYYNARHARGAYRHQAYWFIAGSVLVSVVFGSVFYAFGVAPRIHTFAEGVPVFRDFIQDRDRLWLKADTGLLAGEITELFGGDELFELVDFNGAYWIVIPSDNYVPPPAFFKIEEGVQVRMVGEQLDANQFEAELVMPYHIGPGVMKGKINGFAPPSGGGQHRQWFNE